MLVEITADFGGARLLQLALGSGTAVDETIFGGAFFGLPSLGSLAGGPQIVNFSHAWS